MEQVSFDSLDDLIDAVSHADVVWARMAIAAADFALIGGWATDGWVSMNSWMQHHCRLSFADARRLLSEGRFLRRYPVVAAAALSGRLSGSQVRSIRQAVTNPLADLFDEHQHWFVDAVADLHPGDTVTACQQWRVRAEALLDAPSPEGRSHADRVWKSSQLEDGTMVGQFAFDTVGAAQLSKALDTARTWDNGDERTQVQTMADAMVTIAAFFNANHAGAGTPRHRPHIEFSLEAHSILHPDCDRSDCWTHEASERGALFDALNADRLTTVNGIVMPDWAADAFCCDSVMHRVMRSKSAVLDYGMTERTAPIDLFRAVANRDKGCRFPGCDRPVKWCEAHHIQRWELQGPTSYRNLLLLCNYHHHFIHRQRWEVQLLPSAEARFIKPDGTMFVSHPRGRPIIRDPIAA